MNHVFWVEIMFDAKAGVWVIADTDLPGLYIEADSEEAMRERIKLLGPELIRLNAHTFEILVNSK